MSRADVEADIRDTLGLVPSFWSEVPDTLIESEWASFKAVELAETAIPNKYKELIGLAVSGATRCRYCAFFHGEAARLFGATDEEIAEAALMAKHTMGWSTYLNTLLVRRGRVPRRVRADRRVRALPGAGPGLTPCASPACGPTWSRSPRRRRSSRRWPPGRVWRCR